MLSDTLDSIAVWFQMAVPSPTSKNMHTQIGVHFEEVSEMIAGLYTDDLKTGALLLRAEAIMSELADHLKAGDDLIIVKKGETEVLDAICDQIVTAIGVGHMLNYETQDALAEVDASNWSKFDEGVPIFNENQKIIKGPDYFKPDLKQYI